jgi:hypothetical protein
MKNLRLLILIVSLILTLSNINVTAKKSPPPAPSDTTPAASEAPEPAQPLVLRTRTRFRVINMIPNAQSNETNQDSEPNLAVDPADVTRMVGSAFTFNQTGAVDSAPIFASTDGGNTWFLNNIVPSANGSTSDIALDFATRGHTLYTGTLRGGALFEMNILRSANPFGAAMMTTLVTRGNNASREDQPYPTALTTLVSGSDRDRVFVGNNNLGTGTGRTATVDHSANARTAAAPAGFSNNVIEARNTNGQDRPSIRTAAHSSGVVYGLFGRTTASAGTSRTVDVTVVRDDNFAIGASPFTALTGGDGSAGVLVATGVNMPFINAPALGQNRLGSHMSIAVDPNNSATVFIAWTDRTGATGTVLHVRRSTNSGGLWTADMLTINNALNPALAVNSSGTVACLFQQLVGGRWETHFQRVAVGAAVGTAWSDVILSNTPDNTPAPVFQPYIGDYCDLISVGQNFYGVFSATNAPVMANFPQGVTYQRNANFATNQLRNLTNTGNVAASIDPYFFAAEQVSIIWDLCIINPSACRVATLDPNMVKVKCLTEPCVVVDPVPRNCLVKFNCPGCEGPNVLCPPYYHMYFDNVDPEQWQVTLVYKNGQGVPFELNRTDKGIVISFRPDKQKFVEKRIGDYTIIFRADKLGGRRDFEFPARLEVSDYRYKEHVKFGR